MSILVSGGTGFIGSHTVVTLLNAGYDVVIVDNFYNSLPDVLDKIETITHKKPKFYQGDVGDGEFLETVFHPHKFEAIIHFAGYKAVGESVHLPLMYYRNNLLSTIVLAEKAIKYSVPQFIFSSSATVYGDQVSPLKEDYPRGLTTSPYGETKAISERILRDASLANPTLSVSLLRYFNPVGAHESGLIGEIPSGTPNNLMPYVTQVAKGKLPFLRVFGKDYPTVDGTGVRDFIHVVDLAEGHMAALKAHLPGVNVFNLGTGKGTSVLQLVDAFKRVNGVDVPVQIVERRPGDIATSYADVSKAKELLSWEARFGIDEMVRDAWKFEKNLSQ